MRVIILNIIFSFLPFLNLSLLIISNNNTIGKYTILHKDINTDKVNNNISSLRFILLFL